MLQVGVVVAQPPLIMPDGDGHIDGKDGVEHQHIDDGGWGEIDVVPDCLQCAEHHDGHGGGDEGPERSAAVLQHGEQDAEEGDEHPHAVEYGEQRKEQGLLVEASGVGQQPIDVAHGYHAVEYCRPPSQPCGRRHAGRDNVHLAQQQVEAQQQRRHRRPAVEREVEHYLWSS